MDTHLVINIIILCVGIWLWINNKALARDSTKPLEYVELLYKLKMITGQSEYEIFKLAASEKGHAEYKVDDDFSRYLRSNAEYLPVYLQQFLEDGREYIMDTKISKWVW